MIEHLIVLALVGYIILITYKINKNMNNLTLTLNASDIAHAVKSDTYITGQIDKSADMVKNAALAYNEQAGDETYHNMKLLRTMKGALAKLEAAIAEYVDTSSQSATVTDTLASTTGTFTITISVGDRTSGAFVNTMAYLSQEYIINTMLYYWWQPIKPTLAKDYIAFASDNLLDIKRCLAKSAPSSNASYDDISGSVQAQSVLSFPLSEYSVQLGSAFAAPEISKYPSDANVGYSSSNGAVATVNATTGAVTLVSTGDAVITAAFAGNTDYTPSTASYTLHVVPTPPDIDPDLEGDPVELAAPGESWYYDYTPAVGVEDDVVAESSDTSAATVSVANRRVTITSQTGTPSTCTVTVSSALFGLTETITVEINGGA